MLLALLFKFNFFGDINFSVMECLIFSALITTTVSFFSNQLTMIHLPLSRTTSLKLLSIMSCSIQ